MAGKKWPKSKPITIKLLEQQIAKKPGNMTMTEWIRALIDNQDRFSNSEVFDAPEQ